MVCLGEDFNVLHWDQFTFAMQGKVRSHRKLIWLSFVYWALSAGVRAMKSWDSGKANLVAEG